MRSCRRRVEARRLSVALRRRRPRKWGHAVDGVHILIYRIPQQEESSVGHGGDVMRGWRWEGDRQPEGLWLLFFSFLHRIQSNIKKERKKGSII